MRIVCIDDEKKFIEDFVENLILEGFDVVGYTDGFKAAQEIESNPPDIIITDMKMPGVHGLMMLFTAKKVCPNSHILVFSGNTKEQSEKCPCCTVR